MDCDGFCVKYKKSRKYDTDNSRYCKMCNVFLEWKNLRCPCCESFLKSKPRNSTRRKAHEIKYPDRAIKRH